MELRQPTGADCVWYQELLASDKPPNAVALIVHFSSLSLEEVEAMPSKDVWPLYRKAQDAMMEGFPSGEAD
jgi:hypothetical protein